jgi:hypothetical protein
MPAMNEYLRKKIRGEDVDVANLKTDNLLALTRFGKPHDDPERARAAFESSMKALSDRTTVAHDYVEITFQADLSPVDGVGTAAIWAAKLRQLGVLADADQIFPSD